MYDENLPVHIASWLLLIAWIAWWLWAADWRKLWPALARGAWAPVVLLGLMVAFAWSLITPGSYPLLGAEFPDFWWQLAAVTMLLALAGFCGWLQGLSRCHPEEIELAPRASHGHGSHGH